MPVALLSGASLIALMVLIALARSGHFIRSLLYSALTGNLALIGAGWLGAFSGNLLLSVNPFTIGVSSLLGVPGVLAMAVLKLIFS